MTGNVPPELTQLEGPHDVGFDLSTPTELPAQQAAEVVEQIEQIPESEETIPESTTRRAYQNALRGEHSNFTAGQYIGSAVAVTGLLLVGASVTSGERAADEPVTIISVDDQFESSVQNQLNSADGVEPYIVPVEVPPYELFGEADEPIPQSDEPAALAESEPTATPEPEALNPSEEAEKSKAESMPIVAASPPLKVRMNTDEFSFDVPLIPEDGFVTGTDAQGNQLYNFSAKPGDFVNGVYWTKSANPGTDPAYFESQLSKGLGTTVMIGAHQSGRTNAAFNGLLPENVDLGDTFEVETAEGVFTYEVTTMLDPKKGTLSKYKDELSIYRPNEAVLIACIPNGLAASTNNFAVRGDLIDVDTK